MKLVVGLGNPGKKYAKTRHNIGWMAVEMLAKELDGSFATKKEFKTRIAETRIGKEKVLFALPLTFMNASGEAVAHLKNFYKIPLKDILIVHDEMDFPVGRMAFLAEGGPAGHNGVASIQELLGTEKIARIRLGIGRPALPVKKEDYVLQPFSIDEKKIKEDILKQSTDGIRDWINLGLDKAMNSWNGV